MVPLQASFLNMARSSQKSEPPEWGFPEDESLPRLCHGFFWTRAPGRFGASGRVPAMEPPADLELRLAGLDGGELRFSVAGEMRGTELLRLVRSQLPSRPGGRSRGVNRLGGWVGGWLVG